MNQLDTLTWGIVIIGLISIIAATAIALIFLYRIAAAAHRTLLATATATTDALAATTAAQLASYTQMAEAFSTSLAQIIAATTTLIAPYAPADSSTSTPVEPLAPETRTGLIGELRQQIVAGYAAANNASMLDPNQDGDTYVDWVDQFIPAEPEPRARIMMPGAHPLDYIRAAADVLAEPEEESADGH